MPTRPANEERSGDRDAQIKGLCNARTTGTLMHNKFFVLVRNDQPIAVWTGSTNLAENGIFGHLNCGHLVEDAAVAQRVPRLLEASCATTPTPRTLKDWIGGNNPRRRRRLPDDYVSSRPGAACRARRYADARRPARRRRCS